VNAPILQGAFQVGDRVRVLDSSELGDVRMMLPGGFVELELGTGQLITCKAADLALVARVRVASALELSPSPLGVASLLEEGDRAAARYAARIVARAEMLSVLGELCEAAPGEPVDGQAARALLEAVRDYLTDEAADAVEPELEGVPTADDLALMSPGELETLEPAALTLVRLRFAVARRRRMLNIVERGGRS